MECPSRFCNHENPEEANYYENCGLDMSFDKQKALISDALYACFVDLKGTSGGKLKEMEMELSDFLNSQRKVFIL